MWGSEILESLSLITQSFSAKRQVIIVCDEAERFGGFFSIVPEADPVFQLYSGATIASQIAAVEAPSHQTFALPCFARVRSLGLQRGQPVSFTRECVALLDAVSSTFPDLTDDDTLITVLTDNQGLATAFTHIKPRTPALFRAVARFKETLPPHVQVNVEWHSRSTPLAQLADQLSKVGHMFLTDNGISFLRKHLGWYPPVLISHQKLLLMSKFWLRLYSNTPQTFLIHPDVVQKDCAQLFNDFRHYQAQGAVFTPWVPTILEGQIIATVEPDAEYFRFDYSSRSHPLFLLRL